MKQRIDPRIRVFTVQKKNILCILNVEKRTSITGKKVIPQN